MFNQSADLTSSELTTWRHATLSRLGDSLLPSHHRTIYLLTQGAKRLQCPGCLNTISITFDRETNTFYYTSHYIMPKSSMSVLALCPISQTRVI